MSSAPAILHLLHDLQVGGVQRAIADLAVGLNERGRYRPVVCARRMDGPMRLRCEERGVRAAALGFTRRSAWVVPLFLRDMARGLSAIEGLARRENIGLVHAHMSDSAFWGVVLARRLRCPLVVTIHSNNLVPYQLRGRVVYRRLWRRMLGWTLRRADRVIAVSAAVGRVICRECGTPPDRVIIVTNGIALSPFGAATGPADMRRALGIDERARVVISVGRLVPNKRQADLIGMMPHLLRAEPRAVLLLVGSGPDRPSLAELARRLGVARAVVLTGDRTDVESLLGAGRVYVSASLFEGVSLAMLEAMAAGLPVVAFAAPGVTEVLAGGAGVIVEPRSAASMAAEVARVLADPLETSRLGARARARIAEAYSLDRVISEVSEVYDTLLSGSQRWRR